MPGREMVNVIRHDPTIVHRYAAVAEGAKRQVLAIKEKTEKMTARLVQTAEVTAGGGAAGYITMKYGAVATSGELAGKWLAPELLGVPVDLLVGVGLNVAAHAGLAGKSSTHLHNVGDGFLAWYVGTLMKGAAAMSLSPAERAAAGLPPAAGAPLVP